MLKHRYSGDSDEISSISPEREPQMNLYTVKPDNSSVLGFYQKYNLAISQGSVPELQQKYNLEGM